MNSSTRKIHAILLDVHGALFEKQAEQPRLIPEEGRKFWAQCFEQAVKQHLGVELDINPRVLCEAKLEAELRTPREKMGKLIPPRQFFLLINELIFDTILPQLTAGITPYVRREIAKTVRLLHRDDHLLHTLSDDMREFIEWTRQKNIKIYLQTAQENEKVSALLRENNVPASRFSGIFTTIALGYSKLRQEFWQKMLSKIGLEGHQVLVVGNNTIQDSYCTIVGIPALILDRDGFQGCFLRERGDQLRGAKLLKRGDSLPPKSPFIIFEESPTDFQWWIERINSNGNWKNEENGG